MSIANVVVLVGPSGVGKDTLIDLIVANTDYCRFPAHTTRTARAGEINGVHYNFISHSRFQILFDNGSLLECFEVEGNFYSLSLDDLKTAQANGRKMITHLSVEGIIKLKESGIQVTSVWIRPPYPDSTKKRLQKRGLSEEEIATRINHKSKEEEYEYMFDYQIVNHDQQQERVAAEIINVLEV